MSDIDEPTREDRAVAAGLVRRARAANSDDAVDIVREAIAREIAYERAEALTPLLALADEFDAQVPWPHSWIGNRIREAAGVKK